MRRLLLLAIALGCVAPALAQPDAYDAELVFALTGLSGPDALLVGAAPDSLAPFVPAGAEVLATTDRPGVYRSRSVTILARLDTPPDEAREAYVAPEVPGWSLRPRFTPPNGLLQQVGFATDYDTSGPRSIVFDAEAGPPAAVSVRFRPRGAERSTVEVEYRRLHAMEAGGAVRTPRPDPSLEAALPFLTPPPGGRQSWTGGGGGDHAYTTQALLDADLDPAAVAAHYGALMEAGGWAPGGSAAADVVATSAWTREYDGEPVAAMFYARRVEPGAYALRVHLIAASR